jgi:hypothetical protein
MSISAIVDNKDKIVVLHMRAQLGALGLEIKGLRHSSGRSISAFIKQSYKIKKTRKKDVYKAFHDMILDREKELGIEPRPLNRTELSILA